MGIGWTLQGVDGLVPPGMRRSRVLVAWSCAAASTLIVASIVLLSCGEPIRDTRRRIRGMYAPKQAGAIESFGKEQAGLEQLPVNNGEGAGAKEFDGKALALPVGVDQE